MSIAAKIDPWDQLYKEMKKAYFEYTKSRDVASKLGTEFSSTKHSEEILYAKFMEATKACMEYKKY